jgi:hypothetical protein
MPPQGAKALVAGLLGGRRDGPDVSAVVDESRGNAASVEFFNEGSGTAIRLQYAEESPAGALLARIVGDLAPGATASAGLAASLERADPFRLVWLCQDSKGRVRAWSYDGRSKRLRGAGAADPETAFRAMYG